MSTSYKSLQLLLQCLTYPVLVRVQWGLILTAILSCYLNRNYAPMVPNSTTGVFLDCVLCICIYLAKFVLNALADTGFWKGVERGY